VTFDWLRRWRRPTLLPPGLALERPVAPVKPAAVPSAYLPLYTYLERRYAGTVVLTFAEIEALLGFVPPPAAYADAAWWTGPAAKSDRHAAAWTAAHRSAAPHLGARTVTFERQP
jgi:hypothetical protein